MPYNADSGKTQIQADFEFEADRPYQFSVYRDLTVGDGDIELEMHSRLETDGTLIVEQRLVNHDPELIDFKCVLVAPGRKLYRIQVFRLGANPDIKLYQFPGGEDLIGQEISLRVEEIGGSRVLNRRFIVEQ